MIKSFKCPETKKIWEGIGSKKIAHHIQHTARRKLRMLNNAQSLNDLRIPPSNRLESLRGEKSGQFSIRINNQWRLCFQWVGKDAHGIEIIDYH